RRGVRHLLQRRVTDVEEFVETLERIARGGSGVDPALVQELVSARRRDDPLAALSTREREVLALMAEGRSNAGIARRLWVTEGTVEKHVRSILAKLELPETDDDHRRVSRWWRFWRRTSPRRHRRPCRRGRAGRGWRRRTGRPLTGSRWRRSPRSGRRSRPRRGWRPGSRWTVVGPAAAGAA